MNKKSLKTAEKSILTSFWVRAAPESWLKYTTATVVCACTNGTCTYLYKAMAIYLYEHTNVPTSLLCMISDLLLTASEFGMQGVRRRKTLRIPDLDASSNTFSPASEARREVANLT